MTSSISEGEKAIFSSDLSGKEIIMRLNEQEINNYLQPFFGQHEDGFQQAWLEILERDPQTLEEVAPIVRKIRNRAIKQYLIRKYKEDSLYKPIGKDGDERFTLESILASPTGEVSEEYSVRDGFYKKIVDFLVGEYLSQKNENLALKRKEIDLKAERLLLRKELLKFKKYRFSSWKKLMEDKGKQKEKQLKLKVRLQREKIAFKKEQLSLKLKNKDERCR